MRLFSVPFIVIFMVLSGCADIAVTNGTYQPSEIHESDTIIVDAEVANLGTTLINDAKVSVFFGVGKTAYALADQELPSVNLPPATHTTIRINWPPKPGWGNKDVRIWALADAGRDIDEVDEQNNSYEIVNKVRIQPDIPFVCGNNMLIMARFSTMQYQCFDIREHNLSQIKSTITNTTGRILLYGFYAVIDCAVELVVKCDGHIRYLDAQQHEFQTNYVGAGTILHLDQAQLPNPWNLVYIAVYPSINELEEDCGAGANACAGGSLIAITEWHLNLAGTYSAIVISEGAGMYWYTQYIPDSCQPLEYHEYQHIINRLLLQSHQSWFEEMIARLFADNVVFPLSLCPDIEFTNIFHEDAFGEVTAMAEPPKLYEINSERPLDNFARYYAAGDSCREAIIMQMNREALANGQSYLRKLFQILRHESLADKHLIAAAILLASDNDANVRDFLLINSCNVTN
jgi:CARDB